MLELARDIRYALRVLLRNPGATAAAVLAMALGIGVNASCFISVNALVLHPLPYPALERIMTLWETVPKLRNERDTAAPANFLDWREQSRSFEHLAALRPWNVTRTGAGEPERVEGWQASPEFFAVLGTQPMLGRTFVAGEAEAGRDGVVVVSHTFWQQRLGAAREAVGRPLTLAGRDYLVIGVMPADFDFPLQAELWAPLALTSQERYERAAHGLMVLGLLRAGTSPPQARAEMAGIAHSLETRYPQSNESRGVLVIPVRELTNEVTDRFTISLLCGALFVLLLACANVGNLHLSRVAAREREVAVRMAIGASRLRIARQLLCESLVIALAGGALGLLLAAWNVEYNRTAIPAQVARWVAGIRFMRINAEVVVFTIAISLVAGVACALPALLHTLGRASSRDLGDALKQRGRRSTGADRGRLRHALVIAEVALALVLLLGATAMVRTFNRMVALHPGFDTRNLLLMQVTLPSASYRDPAQVRGFYDRSLAGLATLAGVTSVGAEAGIGLAEGIWIEGRPEPRPGEPRTDLYAISAGYLETMRIPVLAGRSIASEDGPDSAPVAVISESVARHYWPAANPLGQRIRLGNQRSTWLTVVGVSGDVKDWFFARPHPAAYLACRQAPVLGMQFVLRTAGDPMLVASGASARIREIDRNQPVYDVGSMEQLVATQTSGVRFAARYMTLYALIALLLAVTGTYAVISYSVAQRTHEFGIRLALGARAEQILRMTLGRAMGLAAIGLSIGLVTGFLMMKVLASVLYDVIAVDWWTLPLFTALLGAFALLASYIPARRVTRIDPLVALHDE